ncbi:MAG: class I SAM-dependent methyltransferase [Acidimicrobiia bacterium]|nr:class I SAM-dependent methyltransferase [Acidimicrobiia bacterium]
MSTATPPLDEASLELPAGAEWVDERCPACEHDRLVVFFREPQIPTNSCLLLASPTEATSYRRGDLALGFCPSCGFVCNTTFDVARAEYSQRYEETQVFSSHFAEFGQELAKRWVRDFDLVGKTVLEIGCGKGEFLVWMVEAGAGRGIGIDPGIHPERIETSSGDRLTWIKDFYDERHAGELEADAIVCRHTLEHIRPVRSFMQVIRRSLGDRTDVPVLFELPDVARVLEEAAFWDVYYEHCSYFSLGSLARLFRSTGFEVTGLHVEYDDQYLLVEARPSTTPDQGQPLPVEDDLNRLWLGVHTYADQVTDARKHWAARFRAVSERGGRSVIWGAGSKGVSFLTNLGLGDLVDAAVDINPYKTGMFMAGTGHEILAPDQLVDRCPALVVVMNPIYVDEVRAELDRLGIAADVAAV